MLCNLQHTEIMGSLLSGLSSLLVRPQQEKQQLHADTSLVKGANDGGARPRGGVCAAKRPRRRFFPRGFSVPWMDGGGVQMPSTSASTCWP